MLCLVWIGIDELWGFDGVSDFGAPQLCAALLLGGTDVIVYTSQ